MYNVVVYHDKCCDGKMSAAVARHFLNKCSIKTEYRAHDYNNEEQVEELFRFAQDKTVNRIFIVDFSFPTEVLNALAKHCEQVVVLDHHASAMERININGLRSNVVCVLDKEFAGCMLTWRYFSNNKLTYTEFPKPVQLVGVRDLWLDGWQETWPEAKALHAALATKPLNYFNQLLEDYLEFTPGAFNKKLLQVALDEGAVALNVLEDLRLSSLSTAKDLKLEYEIEGKTRHLLVQLNYLPYQLISEHADIVKYEYDCVITANLINEDTVKLSFRSSSGWAKPLAVALNEKGGGHSNAAGCVVSTEEFNSFVKNKKL